MPLADYDSICEVTQRIIVSRDKGEKREHIAHNAHRAHVSHYQVDGNIICDETSCDFLVMNDDQKTAYLIELKGSDILKAVRQLDVTNKKLQDKLKGYHVFFRIVLSKTRTHAIESTEFKKYKKRWGKYFAHCNNCLEENI